MQAITSSTLAIEATAQVWRLMVDFVKDVKIEHGRGCVFYDKETGDFGYLSLFELQQEGAGEIDPDIYRQLLTIVGGEYDFHSEFVLLVKYNFQSEIKYVLQTGELSYEGWRGVKSPEEIREQERADQLAVARQLRAVLAQQRKSKKRGKR
jgi:hypothetical protein